MARELLLAGLILAGSYVAARLLSWLLGRVMARAAERAQDDALIRAVKRPVTYLLLLAGFHAALLRSPLPEAWQARVGQWLFVLGVFLAALALTRAVGIAIAWAATRAGAVPEVSVAREFTPLLDKLSTVAITLVALIVVLDHFHIDAKSLVVSLGVGSLAVGLAAQDTLSNMFAGFTLMFDRPFAIGDRIRLSTGELGDVLTIGMRATRIKTVDDTVLVIPNGILVKERVHNLSQPSRSVTIRAEIGVAYGSDPGEVRRILVEAASASPHLDPSRVPQVLLRRLGDFALEFALVAWAKECNDMGLALSDVYERAYAALNAAGIEIPAPLLPSPPGRRGSDAGA